MKLQLVRILHDLTSDDFEKFKWTLLNMDSKVDIEGSALEDATRERTVDILVKKYPKRYMSITRRTLEECGFNNMVERLLSCKC